MQIIMNSIPTEHILTKSNKFKSYQILPALEKMIKGISGINRGT